MRWDRLRDELWWLMRENCQKGLYSFPSKTKVERDMSNELCNELSSLLYDFSNSGAYKLEAKKQAKLRGVASPNIADALAISEYFYSVAHLLFNRKLKQRNRKKRPWEKDSKHDRGSQSWMAA